MVVGHQFQVTQTTYRGMVYFSFGLGNPLQALPHLFMLGVKWNYVVVNIFLNGIVIACITWACFLWISLMNYDFDREAMVWHPLTHVSIKSSWNKKYIVFCVNWAPKSVNKVISHDKNWWESLFFSYKRGCNKTTVKLVQKTMHEIPLPTLNMEIPPSPSAHQQQ